MFGPEAQVVPEGSMRGSAEWGGACGVYLGKGANNFHAAGSLDTGLLLLRNDLFEAKTLSTCDTSTLSDSRKSTPPSRLPQ